ncbi:MAG: redox-regulated ATPase YchF [Alphaproteobacteria bacterium GWC2_42_16]|nr:MAG: redox-regulated ATPase YchF [Alphaproteobacteria bacterium GWC2_42_16]OFW74264.1 MAG: redox-regulated ATPase YchF [Alphaproteobacteria bacterium GWA2_41_27]OFW84489.1 MAG: redox-regulated ATPase YchF [Alphaproteobacteria bacterium RIFCSPHIGHO2_12_FULL_42_100]OFW86700.1 MAG: redox-regulated ATPase YchF [Alphaproteobacteria bacterium RBG_16_42_14]OFW92335.1 MAG: redox-regulated ATPase YchF [Alphaproteobacteria bacterium RIFCSPHIGHO2_02_FULL_42_30]OFW93730.1 MAG: redox-regulated ATPase Yc
MGFKCGIVGLPNVGKSTLFNALTATAAAEAANYPFCTIEPNIGRVGVPDKRLDELACLANSAKIIPTQLEFVDIAGLVRGASKGEGLGNQFLAHIREVDAIVHVVRCFENPDIAHVEGEINPIRDIEVVETELMLADMESLEKRLPASEKKLRAKDLEALAQFPLMERALKLLKEGKPARFVQSSPEEREILKHLQLITSKPVLYVCNVAEEEAATGNALTEQVKELAQREGGQAAIVSAAIEAEVASLDSEEEKTEFLQSLGLSETGLARVIREGYALLNLLTFFTIGPKEARAWTVEKGAKAPQAAGVIHTDFERGFICAETISYADYVAYKGELGAKAAGKLRLEGRNYDVQDGDVFHFRFNV